MRINLALSTLVLLLLGTLPTAAEDEEPKPAPKPPLSTHERLAEEFVQALAAQDRERMAEIANATDKMSEDPWRVTEWLLETGHPDAARALAAATVGPELAPLAAYVETQAKAPRDTASREALRKMWREWNSWPREELASHFDTVDTTPKDVTSVLALYIRGNAHYVHKDFDEAIKYTTQAADQSSRIGWISMAATMYSLAGGVAAEENQEDLAIALLIRQLEHEVRGESEHGNGSSSRFGPILLRRAFKGMTGTKAATREQSESLLTQLPRGSLLMELARCSPNAQTTWYVALALQMDGEVDRARRLLENIRDRTGYFGEKADGAVLGYNLGLIYLAAGRPSQGLETLEAAHVLARELKMTTLATFSMTAASMCAATLGEYERSLELAQAGLALVEKTGARVAEPILLTAMGRCASNRGEYHLALRRLERARAMHVEQGAKTDAIAIGMELGAVHLALGDLEKAQAEFAAAYSQSRAAKDLSGILSGLSNLGVVALEGERYSEAEASFQSVVTRAREEDRPSSLAVGLTNLADLYRALGRFDEAAARQKEAVEAARKSGLGRVLGNAYADLALIELARKQYAEAARNARAAREHAHEMGSVPLLLRASTALTLTHRAAGEHKEAIKTGREVAAALAEVTGRVGDEPGARARSRFVGALQAAASSAVDLKQTEDFAFFLETGRAGLLREALGGRQILAEATVPPDLRRREQKARESMMRAEAARTAAQTLPGAQAATRELRRARADLQSTIERIEGEVLQGADLIYARPDSLEAIQSALAKGEVCVLYGLFGNEAYALRLTLAKARIIRLGPTAQIEAALEALRRAVLTDAPVDALAEKARRLVTDPLDLKGVRRLLISPDGGLCSTPPILLFPSSAETVYLPPGTWYARSARRPARRGEKVLALGDVSYTPPDRMLPESGPEAESVGDVVLLGERATKPILREVLKQEKHWRAVHFACHGLSDQRRPVLSRLELSPDPHGDRDLLAIEVQRMHVPTDLVVLSACESGLGRVFRGTGLLGLTRAFLSAGSSRVLCSLWKVDDRAARVLMEKFYELWEGEAGLSAPAALRAAQEYVRTRDGPTVTRLRGAGSKRPNSASDWAHPYFWAGWVVWGRP